MSYINIIKIRQNVKRKDLYYIIVNNIDVYI